MSDLSLEDSSTLKDPMDKKAELLLKRGMGSGASNLNPAIAYTARTLLLWLNQLQELLEGDASRENILKTMPTLMRAAAFIADSSAKAVKITARATALINLARRALWFRVDLGCCLQKQIAWYAFHRQASLWTRSGTQVLDRSADRNKGFRQQKQSTFSPAEKVTSKAKQERDGPFLRGRKNREDFILSPSRGNTKKR